MAQTATKKPAAKRPATKKTAAKKPAAKPTAKVKTPPRKPETKAQEKQRLDMAAKVFGDMLSTAPLPPPVAPRPNGEFDLEFALVCDGQELRRVTSREEADLIAKAEARMTKRPVQVCRGGAVLAEFTNEPLVVDMTSTAKKPRTKSAKKPVEAVQVPEGEVIYFMRGNDARVWRLSESGAIDVLEGETWKHVRTADYTEVATSILTNTRGRRLAEAPALAA